MREANRAEWETLSHLPKFGAKCEYHTCFDWTGLRPCASDNPSRVNRPARELPSGRFGASNVSGAEQADRRTVRW